MIARRAMVGSGGAVLRPGCRGRKMKRLRSASPIQRFMEKSVIPGFKHVLNPERSGAKAFGSTKSTGPVKRRVPILQKAESP